MTTEAQPQTSSSRSLLDELKALPESEQRAFADRLTPEEAEAIQRREWRWIARQDQLPPKGDWSVWVLQSGRGAGKTRAGSEWVNEQVRTGRCKRLALVARTAADVRDTMIEGESGILACSRPSEEPVYIGSKRRLEWPNGAIATTYTAEEPAQLRGPQHDGAWCDEVAAWKDAPRGLADDTTWSNLLFGLRLGSDPRVVVTTTPKPFKLYRDIIAASGTAVTRASTYDNLANLAPTFRKSVVSQYEGTRLGRQELNGEVLEDVVGALWWQALIEPHRVNPEDVPDLRRVVVAIDPAVSSGDESAETGLVVGGIDAAGHCYVLADASGRYTPLEWAERAVNLYREHKADRIIGEVNNGGDLVEANIRTVNRQVPFAKVVASRGKATRAEPIASLYEQGRFHHAGAFPELEDQMTTWVPGTGMASPDRLDALVWLGTELNPHDGEPQMWF